MSNTFDDEDFYDGPATRSATVAPAAPQPVPVMPAVSARTTARPVAPAAYLLIPDEQWTPANLRDYVTGQIVKNGGIARTANPAAEMAIFKSFCDRWKELAVPIARHAFEVNGGWWGNAPIGVNRFCKNSDPYFATPIAERLPGSQR